jgi:hypothetical protein
MLLPIQAQRQQQLSRRPPRRVQQAQRPPRHCRQQLRRLQAQRQQQLSRRPPRQVRQQRHCQYFVKVYVESLEKTVTDLVVHPIIRIIV